MSHFPSHMGFLRPPGAPRIGQQIGALVVILGAVALSSRAATASETKVTVGGLAQVRHTYQPSVDDPATSVDEGLNDTANSFFLRRGRITLKARRGDVQLRGGFTFSKNNPRLQSLYIRADLPRGFQLRVGQSKRLLTYAYLSKSTNQRMIERSPVGDDVGSNRDVGIRLRRRFFKRFINIQLAVFNGNGPNTLGNDDGGLLYEGRVDVHLLRPLDLSKAKIGRKLAMRVGAAVARNSLPSVRENKDDVVLTKEDISMAWSVHGAIRWQRFELQAELLNHEVSPVDARADTSTPLGIAATTERGWSVQLAWQPPRMNRRLEVATRFFRWEKEPGNSDTRTDEIEACVGWRLDGDAVKIQWGARQKTKHRAGGVSFSSYRSQLQLQVDM
ncbi:MAG: hypothetical protein KC502_23125 [Myxococcales bacterium]|nr:hypothetical protein [Myxococcales bacterium]